MIVHGGAGSGKYPKGDRRFAGLLDALDVGMRVMRRGSSLDGVEAAVKHMEDSGVFNAGRGACLTADGKVELDAGVMTGDGLRGAGVGVIRCTYNPVSLARWVAENTSHVLVAGDRAVTYARAAGMKVERVVPSSSSRAKFRKLLGEERTKEKVRLWRGIQEGNTVGAVAIDQDGVPSAAVSTGGMWMKFPGRIGDSSIIGAGFYADLKKGAACATGVGEEIIRSALSLRACEYMAKKDAQSAADYVIALVTKRSGKGTAGVITVDLKGRVGFSYNTEAMGTAWYDHVKGRGLVQV